MAAKTFPPGLVGEIAQFIFEAAPMPVHEIALVGAVGRHGIVLREMGIGEKSGIARPVGLDQIPSLSGFVLHISNSISVELLCTDEIPIPSLQPKIGSLLLGSNNEVAILSGDNVQNGKVWSLVSGKAVERRGIWIDSWRLVRRSENGVTTLCELGANEGHVPTVL